MNSRLALIICMLVVNSCSFIILGTQKKSKSKRKCDEDERGKHKKKRKHKYKGSTEEEAEESSERSSESTNSGKLISVFFQSTASFGMWYQINQWPAFIIHCYNVSPFVLHCNDLSIFCR
jgi:hypothetical protein